MSEENKIRLKLIRTAGFGLAISLVWIWFALDDFSLNFNTNDFLLITKEKSTAKGTLVSAEEFTSEIEESNNKVKEVSGYTFKYHFILPNGEKFEGDGSQYGEFPFENSTEEIPFEVNVEYLSENPKVSRIKNLWGNDETIMQWFLHNNILIYLLFSIGCFFFSYVYVKSGIKEYKRVVLK